MNPLLYLIVDQVEVLRGLSHWGIQVMAVHAFRKVQSDLERQEVARTSMRWHLGGDTSVVMVFSLTALLI